MAILETRSLTHIFPNGHGIHNINLTINSGEFIILAGTNGSGKTVFIRHLNGLIRPTQGEILLNGKSIFTNLTETRKKIGLIFQNSDSQIIGQTVAEEVAFGPENLNLSRREVEQRVKEALSAVNLLECASQRPHNLSGGQKRKLAVAGVLAMRPQIIIFDEPFTGLDYPGVIQVLRQIVLLHQQGHTIVLVTHELEKVLAHATRMIIMAKGRICHDGPPASYLSYLEDYGIKKPYGENRRIETMTWLN